MFPPSFPFSSIYFRGYERPDCLRKCVPSGAPLQEMGKGSRYMLTTFKSFIRRLLNVRCGVASFQFEDWIHAAESFFRFYHQWPSDSGNRINEHSRVSSSIRLHQPIRHFLDRNFHDRLHRIHSCDELNSSAAKMTAHPPFGGIFLSTVRS